MATISGYHQFALPPESVKTYEESIEFATLSNDLADGYYYETLFGSDTGLRRWRLSLPTLAHSDIPVPSVTGVNDETVSREEYFWDLFCETKITGQPFVYTSPRNGQYYLARFKDKRLTYEGMRVKLYSTGVEIEQVRIPGVSVFNPLVVPGINVWLDGDTWAPTLGIRWTNLVDTNGYLDDGGDVLVVADGLAGKDFMRLNSVAVNGSFSAGGALGTYTLREAFVVARFREATFSNYGGLIGSLSTGFLVGQEGTNRFFNFAYGNGYQYFLNSIEHPESDQIAPMNEWGLINVRIPAGLTMDGLQLGLDRNFYSVRTGKVDIAAVITTTELVPANIRREILEYLKVRWQTP